MQIEHGSNSLRAKITNQSAILKIIYYFGPIKRADIADRLDLTLPTITTNVNDMIAEGIVRETGICGADGKRVGRKARLVEIVPQARHFIGIEITGTRRAICVVDYCGKVLESYYDSEHCVDYEENIRKTCGIAEACLSRLHLSWQDIYGVCIGLPGVVDRAEGILKVHPGNQWINKNIRADFKQLTGYEGDVAVENNACARASGVKLYRRELLSDVQSFVYLFVDRGIACPLIVNSFHYTESVVGAGEVGHMVMEPGGARCSCGNDGCLEAYSSDRAVIDRCVEAMADGKASVLREICKEDQRPSIAQILAAQKAGDPQVCRIVEKAVYTLGIAVANIVNFTSPDTILIDCKLFSEEENRKLILDTARKNLCNKTYRGVQSVFVEPSNDSGAKGAAAVAINMCMQ
ncbi:ROK family transcriptional regulator [Parablautia sp. Marseille-Q6255]|uniref:ROK family transcriptional regulator n=1 Tax=Parablautia sp. Marseille-Q6255 TaxID=3039593 RepID=UPI0024BD09E6|nr:ROK family transcriptional regulator [Parablautia sp. Marseille-Q6255]